MNMKIEIKCTCILFTNVQLQNDPMVSVRNKSKSSKCDHPFFHSTLIIVAHFSTSKPFVQATQLFAHIVIHWMQWILLLIDTSSKKSLSKKWDNLTVQFTKDYEDNLHWLNFCVIFRYYCYTFWLFAQFIMDLRSSMI